ncbi:MAG: SatD family protein [Bacillota bacterium]|jgi:hypothetical protein
MDNYAVITADIIDSRRQADLVALLKPQLGELNSRALLTTFAISRGDEIQAVCKEPAALPRLIRHLRYLCLPLQLRVAVGIGIIDDLGTDCGVSSWEMNGPAFYAARNALDQMKKAQRKTPATLIASGEPCFDLTINTIYSLYDLIINQWTPRQWTTVQTYEVQATLQKTAEAFNVSWQNIQKICKAAHWETLKATEENLTHLIELRFCPASRS